MEPPIQPFQAKPAAPIPIFFSVTQHPALNTKIGGDDRDRTDDPLLAKQVLSQLSYSPLQPGGSGWT